MKEYPSLRPQLSYHCALEKKKKLKEKKKDQTTAIGLYVYVKIKIIYKDPLFNFVFLFTYIW